MSEISCKTVMIFCTPFQRYIFHTPTAPK